MNKPKLNVLVLITTVIVALNPIIWFVSQEWMEFYLSFCFLSLGVLSYFHAIPIREAKEGVIPYYDVHTSVLRGYHHRDVIWWCLIITLFTASITPWICLVYENLCKDLEVNLLAILIAVVLLFFLHLLIEFIGDALTDTRESILVEQCITYLREKKYNLDTLKDIQTMSEIGSHAFQVRTPLPIILLTVIATVSVISGMPTVVKIYLGMFMYLSLFSLFRSLREANIDVIIRKALVIVMREQRWRQ